MKLSKTEELPEHCYVAITNKGDWGRGASEREALKKARGLSGDGTKVKRGVKAVIHHITGMKDHPMTEADLNPNLNGGLSYTGYKVGDILKPWVTQYGSLVYKGEHLGLRRCEPGQEIPNL